MLNLVYMSPSRVLKGLKVYFVTSRIPVVSVDPVLQTSTKCMFVSFTWILYAKKQVSVSLRFGLWRENKPRFGIQRESGFSKDLELTSP